MTMPVIISKYQTMVIKNQFKKSYSVISNAFNLAIQEMGEGVDCTNKDNSTTTSSISECNTLWQNYFLKNLQVAKYCESKAFENGCVPDYKEENFVNSAGCGGFTATQIKEHQMAAVLSDGTIVFPYGWNGRSFAALGFDVNGFKGPNKGGHDVFSLGIANKGNIPVLGAWRDGYLSFCMPFAEDPLFWYLKDVLY